MRIGIMGCGFIGTTIAGAIYDMEGVESIPLFDMDYDRTMDLAHKIALAEPYAPKNLEEFIANSDIVVESASQNAVSTHVLKAVKKGKDAMILSVGALVDDDLWNELKSHAEKNGSRLYLPSGAIGGIDGITSGCIADVDHVTLTVRKPPKGLSLPADLKHLRDEIMSGKGPVTLFEGSAREAVMIFPKNVNVAATIALAGIGFDRTRVKVLADPSVTRNQHEVNVRGRFGEMIINMYNQPSTTNPRTSYMAPLSAISTIKRILTGVNIGN